MHKQRYSLSATRCDYLICHGEWEEILTLEFAMKRPFRLQLFGGHVASNLEFSSVL